MTLVGGVGNLALALLKFVAGTVGSSAALIADALHSLSDLLTDGVVFVTVKISNQRADEDHPYGHGRAETIGSMIVGSTLMIVGVFMTIDIVGRLIEDELAPPSRIALFVAALSIVVKEVLYHYTVHVGEKHQITAVIANAWHHRSDALSSVAALIGVGGAMWGIPILDPIAAFLVVGMIAKVGFDIARGSIDELMESAPESDRLSEFVEIIENVDGALGAHDLKARSVGGHLFLEAHILVDPYITVSEAHNIAEIVRKELQSKGACADATLHIDAEEDGDYKLKFIDRDEIESNARALIERIDGVKELSEMAIHTLKGRALLDLTVEFDDKITIAQARLSSEKMIALVEKIDSIERALVRAKISSTPRETDFA